MSYPKFKEPQMKIPRHGWNFTVDGYRMERKTLDELVDSVERYIISQGREPGDVRQAVITHICEENPWMCQWGPPEEQKKLEVKPPNSLEQFREWLETHMIEYTDNLTAKRRIDQCLKCPHNDGTEVMRTADRLIWSKHTPHIKLKQCSFHKHDNAVAVWLKTLPEYKEPEVPCWAKESNE